MKKNRRSKGARSARKRQSKSPLQLEQLEQRILFSGDCPVIEEIEADNRGMIVLQASESLVERFVQDDSVIITTAGGDLIFDTNDDVQHDASVTYDRDQQQIRILAEGIDADVRYRVELISEDIIGRTSLMTLDGEFNGADMPTGDGEAGGNLVFFTSSPAEQVARFTTVLGDIDVRLFGDITPQTVANFLNYANNQHWDGTIFHRSVNNFVIQGGGFSSEAPFDRFETDPPVQNEFERSNIRGTIAMAKLGGDPNSATDQWFFNLTNNGNTLDGQNGGFTVFGEITDADGLAVMDAIAALTRVSATNVNSAFTDLPVVNEDADVSDLQTSDLALVSRIATLVNIVGEPAGQIDADAYTFESNRDARVTIFDLDGQGVDRIEDLITVKFSGNKVSSITIKDGAPTRGLGIVITDATSVGSIKDARKSSTADISFVVSSVPVGSINIRGDVTGFNLNGRVVGSMLLPDDIDGDGSIEDDTSFLLMNGQTKKIDVAGDVDGDIVAMNGLNKLIVRGRTTGVDVVIGESENGSAASLQFNQVRNSSIDSEMAISSLKATEWRDTDSERDLIEAPSLSKLTITGERRGGSNGDFASDLMLTEGPENGLNLKKLSIAGDLSRSNWQVDGGIGAVNIKGDARAWRIEVIGELKKINAGAVSNAEFTTAGDIGSIVVTEWIGGIIDGGGKFGSVKTTGDAQRGIDGDWAADMFSRAAEENRPTFGKIHIKGDVLVSAWGVLGSIGSARIDGVTDDLIIAAGFELGSFKAGEVLNSSISAGTLLKKVQVASLESTDVIGFDRTRTVEVVGDARTNNPGNVVDSHISGDFLRLFKVRGDVIDTDFEFDGAPTDDTPVIDTISVGGKLSGSRIQTSGDISSISARGMFSSQVYAGTTDVTFGFPESGDLDGGARIESIEIRRDPSTDLAFGDSYIAAGAITSVNLGPVDSSNGNVPFGVAANTIDDLIYRKNNTVVDAFDAFTDGTEMIFGDFQIRLNFDVPLES